MIIKIPNLEKDYILSYIKDLEENVKNPASEDKSKSRLILKNTLDELCEKELKHFFDKKTSYFIETVLYKADESQTRKLMYMMKGRWIQLSRNESSSHPIQVILNLISKNFFNDKQERLIINDQGEGIPTIKTLFLTICNEFSGNLELLAWNECGSFILRDVLLILSGMDMRNNKRKTIWKKSEAKIVPSHQLVLTKWISEILTFENFPNLIYHKNGGPVINTLIEASHSLCLQSICDVFSRNCILWTKKNGYHYKSNKIENFEYNLLHGCSTSHLVERICLFASQNMVSVLFQNYFLPKLRNLSTNKYSNYSVQKILLRLKCKKDVQKSCRLLFPHFDLLMSTCKGVIWALITACSYFSVNYCEIIKLLMKNLNIKKQRNLFIGLVNNGRKKYSYFDCLIFLTLLKFRVLGITDIFLGLFYLPIKEFTIQPILSRIFDAGIKSSTKLRVRKKFINCLLGSFDDVMNNEFGSNCIENSFWISDLKTKTKVARRLLNRYNKHFGSRFVNLVIHKIRLSKFKENTRVWEKIILSFQRFRKSKMMNFNLLKMNV